MTAPLSWLLMATHVPPSGASGGMVRYAVELAQQLAKHPGVELHVLAQQPSADFFTEMLGSTSRVHTVRALPVAVRSLMERPGIGVPAFRHPFDVVHGIKHLVPRWSRGLKVLTVHDMLPFDRPNDFGRLKRYALRAPYRSSLRDADLLICVSAATRQRIIAEDASLADKAVAVPLATSTRLQQVESTPVSVLQGRTFALVVGDPSPRKNLALPIGVWEEVTRQVPGALLVVVGPKGWGVTAHGAQFESLVAAGSIVALGQVPDGVLRWCYENAGVVLCPSLLEGFGLPVVEALHFGAPLITSNDPALVEACGGRGTNIDAGRPADWVIAISAALARDRPTVEPLRRTWRDIADETVSAVRRTLDAR